MKVNRRANDTRPQFWIRTVSAQLHGIGALLMLAGAFTLIPLSKQAGEPHFWACLSFLATGGLVFFVSSFYHFLVDGFESSPKVHLVFENLDHMSIYLFIAGTYTPFLLGAVKAPWQIPLMITTWTLAFVGMIYTLFKPRLPKLLQRRGVYTGLFVLMGWVLIFRLGEIYTNLTSAQFMLLAGGGLSYSLGAVGYALKRPHLLPGFFGYHELWHLMVLVGAGAHYALIYSFYM